MIVKPGKCGSKGCLGRHSACGFTLIEMATVITIMGLMIVSVLNGYELIVSSKVKKLCQDFNDVQTMIYGYQDKYRVLPGDDPRADQRFPEGLLAGDGSATGNGVIDGNWNSANVSDESFLVWQHLRLSGLTSGAVSFFSEVDQTQSSPKNLEGGRIGIQSTAAFNAGGITDANLTHALVICSDQISGKLAKLMDIALDDGQTHRGAMRAIQSGSMPGPSTETSLIANNLQYTVCMTF
ncbi:hypothetical protein MTYP_01182 [Methylophilaceae bacterium]|nr:hypothetical protein MTYP_01182 [Methylophilaceae bacterium]